MRFYPMNDYTMMYHEQLWIWSEWNLRAQYELGFLISVVMVRWLWLDSKYVKLYKKKKNHLFNIYITSTCPRWLLKKISKVQPDDCKLIEQSSCVISFLKIIVFEETTS